MLANIWEQLALGQETAQEAAKQAAQEAAREAAQEIGAEESARIEKKHKWFRSARTKFKM